MSKEKAGEEKAGEKEQTQKAADGLPLTVHAQYVRDISFENPLAPQALRRGLGPPKTKVNFGMDARRLKEQGLEDMFEVLLTVSAEAHRDGETVFIAEVQYGTTVSLNEIPEDQKHPLLLIEVPRLAFPFVRQIVYNLSVQGGYPPLLLSPVNFHKLYMERFGGPVTQMPDQTESKKGGRDSAKSGKKAGRAKGGKNEKTKKKKAGG